MPIIEWFKNREDYELVRRLLLNEEGFPATFEEWKKRTLETITTYSKSGRRYYTIEINPDEFSAWRQTRRLKNADCTLNTFITEQFGKGNVMDDSA